MLWARGDRLEMTVIGAPVNTAAKLEKHNKVLGTECIVLKGVWERALSEGYVGNLTPEFLSATIDGIENPQEIAVLKI